MRGAVVVVALGFFVGASACKRQLTAEEACKKLAQLQSLSPAERDRCEAEYRGFKDGHEKECVDACVKKATTADDYDRCSTECHPPIGNLASYCQFVAEIGPDLHACGERGRKIEVAASTENPTKLKCLTTCFRTTSDARPNHKPAPGTPTWSQAMDRCEKSCDAPAQSR